MPLRMALAPPTCSRFPMSARRRVKVAEKLVLVQTLHSPNRAASVGLNLRETRW